MKGDIQMKKFRKILAVIMVFSMIFSNAFAITLDSYAHSFDKGTYASEGFAVILIDIEREIGWEPFKKTFRYFLNLSDDKVPETDGEKLKLFLTKLKDFSGEDVLGYISSRDTGIIENQYGITLNYVEPVYPSISDGDSVSSGEISTSGGAFNVYEFTPTESANYYIYTSLYGGSGVSNDTYLEVYTNKELTGTPIASNDDYDGGRFSKVSVALTEGTTYHYTITFEVVTTLGVSFGGTNYQFVVR